uniref:Uncharacterized protein n=1 Tax=Cacopsylla melanoneura TaxID=428564 RepID=A0A8D9E7S1_9HEMI
MVGRGGNFGNTAKLYFTLKSAKKVVFTQFYVENGYKNVYGTREMPKTRLHNTESLFNVRLHTTKGYTIHEIMLVFYTLKSVKKVVFIHFFVGICNKWLYNCLECTGNAKKTNV